MKISSYLKWITDILVSDKLNLKSGNRFNASIRVNYNETLVSQLVFIIFSFLFLTV